MVFGTGPDGGVIVTTKGVYEITSTGSPVLIAVFGTSGDESESDTTQNTLEIKSSDVSRVEYNQGAILYLRNGTTLFKTTDVLCYASGAAGFKRVQIEWVDRFIPFANGSAKAHALVNSTFYACQAGQFVPSLEYPDRYNDIFIDSQSTLTLNSTTVYTTGPRSWATVTTEYHINVGGHTSDTWSLWRKDFVSPSNSQKTNGALYVRRSFLTNPALLGILIPETAVSAATDGVHTFFVTSAGEVFHSEAFQTPTIVSSLIGGVRSVVYNGMFIFLFEDGSLVSWLGGEFGHVSYGISDILGIASGGNRTVVVTKDSLYVRGRCDYDGVSVCGTEPGVNTFSRFVPVPFEAELQSSVLRVASLDAGIVIYLKNGTVLATGPDSEAFCAPATDARVKMVGASRLVRFEPGFEQSYAIDLNGKVSKCRDGLGATSFEEVGGNYYYDYIPGQAHISGDHASLNEIIVTIIENSVFIDSSNFAISVPNPMKFSDEPGGGTNRSLIGIVLGIVFGILGFLIALAIALYCVCKKKQFFLFMFKNKGDKDKKSDAKPAPVKHAKARPARPVKQELGETDIME